MAVTLAGQQPAIATPLDPDDAAVFLLAPQVDKAVAGRDGTTVESARGGGAGAAYTAAAPVWPEPGLADADLPAVAGATAVRAGTLPVAVGRPSVASGRAAGSAVARARVQVLDHASAEAAGFDGLLLRVGRADGGTAVGAATVVVDYSTFRYAYGADWAARLRLVQVPECALTTPSRPECQPVALATRNDPHTAKATADILLPPATTTSPDSETRRLGAAATAAGTLIALTAAGSSGAGDYRATSLQPSSTWSAGGNTGGFSWTYPMRIPPSLGGPAPKVALTYSSQSVDGHMAASNNQPSWIGEGFEYSPGSIERRYKPCSLDMGSGANNTVSSGDLCWATDNATLSLNGSSTELLAQGGNQWRGRADDGSRVEHKMGSPNGDNDGEWWVATTPDGTQYWFGGTGSSNATWTVPVFGNNAGEPCHESGFGSSSCAQAWRWNLDYVIDPHGNTMTYVYGTETNSYARNNTATDLASYVRGGYLDHIDYGSRAGVSTTAPMRVQFTTGDRCLSGCSIHDAAHWPDTPWDQQCTSTPCTVGSPTFWTTKRLATVTTRLWSGTGTTYRDVDRWTLTHSFPATGDDTRAGLWLDRISETGLAATPAVTLPDVVLTGVAMPNRVDSTAGDWAAPMNWPRITQLSTASGATINVTYLPGDCVAPGGLPAQMDNNTKRCYPVKWTPPGFGSPVTDWFHRYLVDTVTQTDPTGGSVRTKTHYDYVGAPAWHYTDDDGLIDNDAKTWSVWRGYATVKTTVGDPGQQQVTQTRFFRGMNGDKQNSGTPRAVTVPAVGGYAPAVPDEDAYAGMPREQSSYVDNGVSEVAATVSEPWQSPPTATRTLAGSTVNARHLQTARTWQRVARDQGRAPVVTATVNHFDSYGMTDQVDDQGDINIAGDERCTLTTYEPRNTTVWLVQAPHRAQTFATSCAAATSGSTLNADDVIADNRSFFDGATTFGTAPTKGDVTRGDVLNAWTPGPGGGNPGTAAYLTISKAAYDPWGRSTEATDVKGNKTTTAYLHNLGGQLTQTTVTNPLGWPTTTISDPAWGLATKVTDPNGRVTEQAYDAFGRLLKVWLPGHDTTTNPNLAYTYNLRADGPTVVTSAKLTPTGGYSTIYTLYDALMRPRQTQQPEGTTLGGRVVADTLYDSAGRGYRTRGPYIAEGLPGNALFLPNADSEIPSVTTTLFDGAGRGTSSVFTSMGTEKWRTTTGYGGDRTDVTPAAGGTAASVVTDARGRETAQWQYHGPTPTPTVAGSYDATSYTYNRKDQLAQVQDPAGNRWSYGYDQRGRLTTSTDPDKGTGTLTLDDAGLLTSIRDARGEVIAYTYDTLGRKTSARDDTTTGPKRAEWIYDTLPGATVVKGQLTKTVRYAGTAAYTNEIVGFNTDYTPTARVITIPPAETGLAGAYRYAYSYWPDGSPSTMSLPDIDGAGTGVAAETLAFGYNTLGMPAALGTDYGGTDTTYVIDTTYTRYGEPTHLGYSTNAGKLVEQARYYEDGTRRIARVIGSRETVPNTLLDVNYTRDPAGNITKIVDLNGGDNQCLTYDYLQRLTNAWTPLNGNCATPPASATLGGPAPYRTNWTYDPAGNRKTQTESATPNTTRTTTYQYPAPGQPQPHTLTSTTATDTTRTTIGNYSYNTTGDTITRPATAGNQNLTWDDEDHLAASTDTTGTTTYLYDADGNRLIRRDPTGKTIYLPGQELHYTTATGTKACTRYYSWTDTIFASRTATGLTWIINDHQGTATTTISANTAQTVASRRQTPYGTQRSATGTWPSTMDKGFVGGTNDNTGLTHLGAREYDPAIGRFISDDPITDTADPQQINGYAYANNTPITASDPSGLKVFEEDGNIPGPPTGGGGTPTSGSPQAHDTAIFLRVLDLERMYPGAMVKSSYGGKPGIDIVCYNCAAIQTGGKSTDVWVWEVKTEAEEERNARGIEQKIKEDIATVQADDLVQRFGQKATWGPAFPQPSAGVVWGMDTQIVTVRSSVKVAGLEVYRVEDTGSRVPVEHPLYKKSSEAYGMADKKNRRYEQSVKNLHEAAVKDDPVSGWGIAVAVGVVVAVVVVYFPQVVVAAAGAGARKILTRIGEKGVVRGAEEACRAAAPSVGVPC
jgi:RHS repeat-associated protein